MGKIGTIYLRSVIYVERRLAGCIEVPAIVQRVVLAEKDLARISSCEELSVSPLLTASLLPGSLTVVYCSSLYFLKAGSNVPTKLESSALMSVFDPQPLLGLALCLEYMMTYRRRRSTASKVSIGFDGSR